MPSHVLPGEFKSICIENRFHSRPELKKTLKRAMKTGDETTILISENFFDKETKLKFLVRLATLASIRHRIKCNISSSYKDRFNDAVERVFAAYTQYYNAQMEQMGQIQGSETPRRLPGKPITPSNNTKLVELDEKIKSLTNDQAKQQVELQKKEEELAKNNSELSKLKNQGLMQPGEVEINRKKIDAVNKVIQEIDEYKKAIAAQYWIASFFVSPDYDVKRLTKAIEAADLPNDTIDYSNIDSKKKDYEEYYQGLLKKQAKHNNLAQQADDIEKANKLIAEQKVELQASIAKATSDLEALGKERAQAAIVNPT